MIEGEFCGEDNCSESNSGFQWLGKLYYNPTTPTLSLAGTVDRRNLRPPQHGRDGDRDCDHQRG